ncbi:MAG: hypothetical protein F6K17_17140, partial [Okeania sp. SIO3C4]|nr:hypothetical protein [Okeania sp. SIO3C4]
MGQNIRDICDRGSPPLSSSSIPTRAPTPSRADEVRPTLRLKPNADRRLRGGHPWIYANEIQTGPETRALARGALVAIAAADGTPLGVAGFNPGALIAGRML